MSSKTEIVTKDSIKFEILEFTATDFTETYPNNTNKNVKGTYSVSGSKLTYVVSTGGAFTPTYTIKGDTLTTTYDAVRVYVKVN